MASAAMAAHPFGIFLGRLSRYDRAVKKVTIYTDGACSGNPGPGGWAAILIFGEDRREISGSDPDTTNNRMEITAALEALRSVKEPCEVDLHSDSRYLCDAMSSWLAKWKSNNWKRGRKPVLNVALWKALDAEAQRHEVQWHWVKAHNHHPENERCDELAVQAIERMRYDQRM